MNYIFKYRSAYMGFAIIWIIMFHFKAFEGVPILGSFFSLGELGVDIFLFLSSFGLCYSLSKDSNTIKFYKRRFIRVIPAWIFLLFLLDIKNKILGYPSPVNVLQYICYYSGLGWWIRSFVSESHNYWYEWYVPSLMAFYIFTPLLYRKSSTFIVKCIVLTLIISVFLPVLSLFLHHEQNMGILVQLIDNLHWTYQRVPVFLSGILFYRFYNNKGYSCEISEKLPSRLVNIMNMSILGGGKNKAYSFIMILISICIFALTIRIPFLDYTIQRLTFYWILPSFLFYVGQLFRFNILNNIFSFIGSFSLELYMIHVVDWPIVVFKMFMYNDNMLLITAVLSCIILSYITSWIFKPISKFISKKLL